MSEVLWDITKSDGSKERVFEQDGKLVQERVTDISGTLNLLKEMRNDTRVHKTDYAGMHHVGFVPFHILDYYGELKGWEKQWYFGSDKTLMNKFINDPDFKYFRIKEGHV